MKIVIYLSLIAFTYALKNYTCPNNTIIEGFTRKFNWIGYNWELLTFHVYSSECISRRDVTVPNYGNDNFEAFIMSSNKNISFLPVKIHENFPKLKIYDANNCAIKEVRYVNFKNLYNLKVVKLNKNNICHIDKDSFKDLGNLEELFLDENRIQSIDQPIFKFIRNLRYLQLDNNNISLIPKFTFKNLLKLEHILIGQNRIEKLVDEHFKSNRKLITIWLERNNLHDLSFMMFDHLDSLKYVDLKKNICTNDFYIKDDFAKMRETIKKYCKN